MTQLSLHGAPEAGQGRTIAIPNLALVVLVGPSGCGKSTFARRHFLPTEVLSSDFFRAMVADDELDQSATTDAFDLLHFAARKRLKAGRLTVVDATSVQPDARKPLVALAREHHVWAVAIVLAIPELECVQRNLARTDRQVPPHVIPQQSAQLRRSLRGLEREGFRHVHVLRSQEEIDAVRVVRQKMWNDRRDEHGPFDLVGDVHGCADELEALLDRLGYAPGPDGARRHPAGRRAVFLGDLVDRGPRVVDTLRLVMAMVEAGSALAVPGNHDVKLVRALRGRNVQVRHGLARSLEELEQETPEFRERVAAFLDGLVSHYVLDGGELVVAHAGMKEEMQGRGSGAVREFALYGETTGETDDFGLPVRYNWAAAYRGRAAVVYGHTPVPEPEWLNRTINLDTGCVFGGRLTALRWPERELVSVPAARTYAEPSRPFLPDEADAPALSTQQRLDEVLDLDDVAGRRIVQTRLAGNVTVREENAAAALEVMSRFAVNPKWLVYLPPTMSPSETSREPGLLEHPAEAFAYFRHQGVPRVVCEEKHMGSRAVVVVCRSEAAARRRFGVEGEGIGVVYTRTGRGFFDDAALQAEVLGIVRDALDASGLWDELGTEWAVLDCELMPWSAKAQALIRDQYAAVGAAATASLGDAVGALRAAAGRGVEAGGLLERFAERARLVADYRDAYRRYCWPVNSVDDLRLAPFHLMATEGRVHTSRDHGWHLEMIGRLCGAASRVLFRTGHRVVDVTDEGAVAEGVRWWEEMTARGGEGMVVKPLEFVARGARGVVQPAVKCRGREYLRLIYGPEYTLPENLERLRQRGLGAKRSLAHREFALGVEGLERFVAGEPLRRVHECVFAVLALESEPVDPRL
ncbi:MAG TPA: polynucleotide kinase-phosphatase [Longimicrobiaceae bacterium]|nr:polynucleotide kinase-phosphatase [Longimicrobiaceae bacterium]